MHFVSFDKLTFELGKYKFIDFPLITDFKVNSSNGPVFRKINWNHKNNSQNEKRKKLGFELPTLTVKVNKINVCKFGKLEL